MGCRVQLRWSTRMSSLQRYVLNPYEKWMQFGEWPWQLTWHLCIVALATYQVAVNTELHGVTERAMGMHFANVFYPDNYAQFNGDDAVHPWPHYYIFTWEDLQADLALAKQRYFGLSDFALTPAQVAQQVNSSCANDCVVDGRHASANGVFFPVLQLKQYRQPAAELLDPKGTFDAHAFHTSTHSVQSNSSDLASFMLRGHNGSHNAFMASLYGMTLTLPVQVWTPSSLWVAWTFTQCTQWLVHIKYHFHSKGQVEVLPGYHLQSACSGDWIEDEQWQRMQQSKGQRDTPQPTAKAPTMLPARRRGALRSQSESQPPPLTSAQGAPLRPLRLPAAEQAGAQAYLTVLVAVAVGVGIAHEVTVVSECCSAAALVRQLTRRAALAGSRGPARRHRVQQEQSGDADAAVSDGRAGELQDAVVAAHAAQGSHWWPAHCAHQCALVRGWHVAASAGNLCNMAYFVLLAVEFKVDSVAKHVSIKAEDVFDSPGRTVAPRLLLGAGAGLLWLSLLQYLEHFPKYYSFILTLKRAMPRLTRFLASVFPLFVGWGLFGLSMFGAYSPRWATRSMTFITLFAYVNGDAMQETFSHTRIIGNSFMTAVSQIYLYTFVFLFMYVVLNVFVAINEEAFFASRPSDSAVIDVNDGRQLPIMLRSVLDAVPPPARATLPPGKTKAA